MTAYETQIDISADPARVWKILTDDMPKSPKPYGILRFEGHIAPGATIKLWSDVSPNRAFALRVDTLTPPQTMVWTGGMPLGLFTGRRTFTLTPSDQGCTFHMREVFTGLLAPMITKSMPDLTPSFTKFAQTLKTTAEAS
ncbi:SRPBCC domain-containing protein [Jannaschia sp. CCS1]|uniref:SRPBCC domain-containing protein n=1 Tax=Jannaschia sp. (strain CCS1) TaxID=290400 RepID=UPI000053C574|nr:SRPBCC domain-containing protein [Jannaschia sp. CCS1]ABD55220.1 hypothetical protein Jann_2303 [Jannaschia sp. CCS1]